MLATGLLAAAATAQIPAGSEFQVNGYTTSAQREPAVAIAADGRFVAVWSSFQGADDDTFNAVNGRLFSSSGNAIGSDFQVNTYTTESQGSPAVAMAAGGSFVVVWENYEYTGASPMDDTINIRARLYDAAGNGGGDILVNEPPDEGVYNPDVAIDPSGNFVVVWEGSYANGDGSDTGIRGQRFDGNGTALGSNFQVNSYTTYNQTAPAVSMASDSSFVVVWQSAGSDGSNYGVRARRFAADGTPDGADFAVNVLTDGFQGRADVAVDPAGGFTVVWDGFATSGSDAEPFSIQGRRFDAPGSPIGSDFQINTYTTGGQGAASIATNSSGTFVVWDSPGSAGSDSGLGAQTGVQRRAFGAAGFPLSEDLQVNTFTTSFQQEPAVAMNENGDVVVVWESLGSASTDSDSDSWSIHGQRFTMPIFADGFESGDVSAWSSSAP